MTLEEGISLYIQLKRAEGLSYATQSIRYRAFLKTVGNLSLNQISVDHVVRFLNRPATTPGSFHDKHGLLRRFFDYWAARGAMARLSMPANRPAPRSNHLPYIYTREELRRLLRLTSLIKSPADKTHPKTLRTVLLALYATGATVSEVTRLSNEVVDLRNGFIKISSPSFRLSRCIPIGGDLVRVMQRYTEWKKRIGIESQFFFSRIDGTGITPQALLCYFVRLRRTAGITGYRDNNQKPCLRDLRATFAVHQITSWIKKKQDLNVMLPALGAYMGNIRLSSMERYLQLTPERFHGALNKLSPQTGRTQWRCDPALLEFLSNL